MILASSSNSVRDIVRKLEKKSTRSVTSVQSKKSAPRVFPSKFEKEEDDDATLSDISTDESENSDDSRFKYAVGVKTIRQQIEDRINRSRNQTSHVLPTHYYKKFSKMESVTNVYSKNQENLFEGSAQVKREEITKVLTATSSPVRNDDATVDQDNRTINTKLENMTAIPETMTQIFEPESVFGDESPLFIEDPSPNISDYTSHADEEDLGDDNDDEEEEEQEEANRNKMKDNVDQNDAHTIKDEVSAITMNEKQFTSSSPKLSTKRSTSSTTAKKDTQTTVESLGTAVVQLLQQALTNNPPKSILSKSNSSCFSMSSLSPIPEDLKEDEEDFEKLKTFMREIGCTQSKANHYATMLIRNGVPGIDVLTRRLQRDGGYLMELGFDPHFAQDILELLVPDSPLLQPQQYSSEPTSFSSYPEPSPMSANSSIIDYCQPSPNLSQTFSQLSAATSLKSRLSQHSLVSNPSSFYLSPSVYDQMLTHPQQATSFDANSAVRSKEFIPPKNYHLEILPSETASIYYQAIQLRDDDAAERLMELAEAGDIFAQGFIMRMHALGQSQFPKDLPKAHEIAKTIFETLKEVVSSKLEDHANFASYLIGVCYSEGLYVAKNPKEAMKWYKNSAKQGYEAAQAYVGYSLYSGIGIVQNRVEAVKWYTLAASQGYAPAQTNLGICYEFGEGVTKDYQQAIRWYTLAAQQQDAPAMYNLGHCYEKGCGVTQNLSKALDYYSQASDLDHAPSQHALGCLYSTGSPEIPKDYAEAARMFKRAADQGFAEAQCKLGLAYENGIGLEKDLKEAVKYYRLAANQGNAAALYYLGYCYFNGLGLSQDHSIAVKLYYKSAKKGYAAAQNNLGFCYFIGGGINQSYTEAVKWYTKAAQQGYAAAQYNLGYCYEKGYGVKSKLNDMVHWYGLAAKQGHPKALAKINEKLKKNSSFSK